MANAETDARLDSMHKLFPDMKEVLDDFPGILYLFTPEQIAGVYDRFMANNGFVWDDAKQEYVKKSEG